LATPRTVAGPGGQEGPAGHAGSGNYRLSDLRALEAQAIHIFREVAAEFERPTLMFSGGKDSIVMLHVAKKAFWPAPVPFPVLHVDTGRNFGEVLEFRDRHAADVGVRVVVAKVQDDIDAGRTVEDPSPGATRNRLQTPTLLRAISEGRHDAVCAKRWRSRSQTVRMILMRAWFLSLPSIRTQGVWRVLVRSTISLTANS